MKNKFKFKNILKKRRNFLILIFFVCIGIFLFKNIFLKSTFKDNIIVLKEAKTRTIKLPAKALVIKDEYLYYLGENNLEEDRKKINVNKEIIDIDTSKIDSNFKKNISSVVENLQKKLKIEDNSNEQLNLENVAYYIRQKNFYKAFSEFKEEFKNFSLDRSYIKGKMFRYSLLNDTFNTDKIVSKNSGFISNKIDGLENIYDFSIVDSVEEDDFNFENSKTLSNISGIKIVDNLKYYLCLKIKHDIIKDVDINDKLTVSFDNKSFIGTIKKIKTSELNDLFILEFSSGFEEILDKRFLDVDIEKTFSKVYELPKTALIQENGENYLVLIDSYNNKKKVKVVIKFIDNLTDTIYIDAIKSYVGPFYNILKDARSINKGDVFK